MASATGKRIYAGRLIRPERLGGSPEWTAGLRRRPTAVWITAAVLALCILLPVVGFPALYVAAVACGVFYLDNEPLELLRLPELGAGRLLVRKVLTAWRNYFLLTAPFALLAVVAHPRTVWMAAAWIPMAALALFHAVVSKYAHYTPDTPTRRPVAARFATAGFILPVLLPLTLCLTVSYTLRAERNLNRYLHDYD